MIVFGQWAENCRPATENFRQAWQSFILRVQMNLFRKKRLERSFSIFYWHWVKNFQPFGETFRQCCQSCNLCVSRDIFRIFFGKHFLVHPLRILSEILVALRQKFFDSLDETFLRVRKKLLRIFLSGKFMFLITVGFWVKDFRKFGKNFSVGFLKLPSTCQDELFRVAKNFRENMKKVCSCWI